MKHNLPIKIELPEHFLYEEVRCGYTISSQMKKVWAVEIDLLMEFQRVCDKYHLKWFVGGGTALGAARHHGFIPWDDDIDVDMLREDYDKLLSVASYEFTGNYFFNNGTNEKGLLRHYSMLMNVQTTAIPTSRVGKKYMYRQGINIDIFPLDNIPDNEQEYQQYMKQLLAVRTKVTSKFTNNANFIAKRPMMANLRHFLKWNIDRFSWYVLGGKKNYPVLLDKICHKYAQSKTQRVACLALYPMSKNRWLMPREWYEMPKLLDFEWFVVPICSNYEQYLTDNYGIWHEFVQGTASHQMGIMDPEKPYTEYIK